MRPTAERCRHRQHCWWSCWSSFRSTRLKSSEHPASASSSGLHRRRTNCTVCSRRWLVARLNTITQSLRHSLYQPSANWSYKTLQPVSSKRRDQINQMFQCQVHYSPSTVQHIFIVCTCFSAARQYISKMIHQKNILKKVESRNIIALIRDILSRWYVTFNGRDLTSFLPFLINTVIKRFQPFMTLNGLVRAMCLWKYRGPSRK